MKLVLAVTTYNRRHVLQRLIKSFLDTRSQLHQWKLIIADDGSEDDTLTYLTSLNISSEVKIIRNERTGIHHQFNSIVRELSAMTFDYCFKCDDDIEFIQNGWEDLYISAIQESGFGHLCYFDPDWRPEKNLNPPVVKGPLISYCVGKDVQGAFFTLTPHVIEKTGYMDVENFGFRGVGHIDYTLRACRLGFNDINHPFDARGSEKYIRYQLDDYSSAMPAPLIKAFESESETKRKYELINEPRTYIPYSEAKISLDYKRERQLLLDQIEILENEKKQYEAEKTWYESELNKYRVELEKIKDWSDSEIKARTEHLEAITQWYNHLPGWYLKLGKIFKLRKKL